MSGPSVTIHDMQNFVENMGGPDIQISSNIGNVIELNSDDLDDGLGLNLLSNNRISSRPAGSSSSGNIHNIAPLDSTNDIQIGNLEPLEGMSFDIPTSGGMDSLPEIQINRESSDGMPSLFGNEQSASGPSINLASTRLSPEEERKQKIDYLTKLNRIEAKGYTLSKRFTLDNTLDEIKMEYDRLVDVKNCENALLTQRRLLMGAITGMEFLNSKFNPFDWQLDGWSESVHENIEEYDEVFEELYDKYKGRGQMAPELKLLMSVVGSGFMFHMSNQFFRSKIGGVTAGDVLKQNPELARQFATTAANMASPAFGNVMGAAINMTRPSTPQQSGPAGPFYSNPNIPTQMQSMPPMAAMPQNMAAIPPPMNRREMKGPSGVDDILKTLQEVRAADVNMNPVAMPPPSAIFTQQPAMQAVSEMASIHSFQEDMISGGGSVHTGTTSRPGGGGRGRRRAAIPATANTMTLNL